jgi:hypothetical protein
MRRIFERKTDQVTGEWRKLHNEKLHNLSDTKNHYADHAKQSEVGGACGMHGRGKCTKFWWESPKE